MFSLKTNCVLRPKIIIGYINDYYHYIKQAKPCLCGLEINNWNNCTSKSNKHLHTVSCCDKHIFIEVGSSNVRGNMSSSHLSSYNRTYCAETLPKTQNIFGELSNEKYEEVEMDKDEEAEEIIMERAAIPKWQRISMPQYNKLIKMHLAKKDLQLALSVLDVMKENRDKPTLYIYRLLLNAFAKQGDIKQCSKLFKKLKDRGFLPPPAVYNTLINVCAESDDTKLALERLKTLRHHFHETRMCLNEIHYATLIKAYGRHKELATAFQIADEANDKNFCTAQTISALFHAVISDKENGLKHGLRLWHNMKRIGIKPSIFHYNLLLKTIKETKLGDLKLHDTLIPDAPETQIQLSEISRPDLLESPPTLNSSLTQVIGEPNFNTSNNDNSAKSISVEDMLSSQNLNHILKENRLILFGGLNKFLTRMKDDNVQPDIKTISLILELIPPTTEAEKYYLKYIKDEGINVDVSFFNILIKRRSLRNQYYYAKDVLNDMQSYHFTPNIMTFGVLAIGCRRHKDGTELLEQMNAIGYEANYIILETLLYHACRFRDFNYILHLMHYLWKRRIILSQNMLHILDKFDEVILQFLDNKAQHNLKQVNETRKGYNKFKIKYETLKEKLQRRKY